MKKLSQFAAIALIVAGSIACGDRKDDNTVVEPAQPAATTESVTTTETSTTSAEAPAPAPAATDSTATPAPAATDSSTTTGASGPTGATATNPPSQQ